MAEGWKIKQVWLCGKCQAENDNAALFCENCATRKESVPQTDNGKVNKLLEPLAKALLWSVENSQVKPEVVLVEAQKIGLNAPNLATLQKANLPKLDKLADNYIKSNRLLATGTGVTTGLPGGLAIVATLPAWYASIIHFSMRAISGVSQAYGFEATTPGGRVLVLAGFAAASEMPDLQIGTRRLSQEKLADYLLNTPNAKPELLIPMLSRQLARHLAIDFAKAGWVNFIPVLGSVVDGSYSYIYLNTVGKKSKQFYRALLLKQNPSVQIAAPTVEINLISRFVTYKNTEGTDVRAYLARPANSDEGKNGAVVLLHDADGLQEHTYQAARKLARQGYLALAPDCSNGKDKATIDTALDYARVLTMRDMSLGLVGFGTGSDAILRYHGTKSACAIGFYPTLDGYDFEQVAGVQAPLLVLYGNQDEPIIAGTVQQLTNALRDSKKPGEVIVYEGAGHAFDDIDNPVYHRTVAELAWEETFFWLEQHLRL